MNAAYPCPLCDEPMVSVGLTTPKGRFRNGPNAKHTCRKNSHYVVLYVLQTPKETGVAKKSARARAEELLRRMDAELEREEEKAA